MSYGALAEAIEAIAARVARLGLDKNEPIAVAIHNPVRVLATALALLRSEYTVALAFGSSHIKYLPEAGIKSVIHETPGDLVPGIRNIQFTDSWLPSPSAVSTAKPAPRPAPLKNGKMIFFTSGTTGQPKPIVITKEA